MRVLPWLAVCVAGALALTPTLPPELRRFLHPYIHLQARDMAALERGDVVARLIESNDRREVVVFGLARIAAPPEAFVDRVRKLEWLRKSSMIAGLGTFSLPPQPADLEGLTLDPPDIGGIEDCQVGDCAVRLSAQAIRRLHTDVDWRSRTAPSQALATFKQILLEHVRAYVEGGDAALADFHDRAQPVRPADEVREILGRSPYLRGYAPELHDHLRTFPSSSMSAAENIVYWSKERFGAKPVISITHMTIAARRQAGVGPRPGDQAGVGPRPGDQAGVGPRPGDQAGVGPRPEAISGATDTLIASKQIYASHYFDASLGLTAVFDDSSASSGPRFYLVYVNRSRTRSLDSAFRALARVMVKRRARDGVERMLRGLKKTLEKHPDARRVNPSSD